MIKKIAMMQDEKLSIQMIALCSAVIVTVLIVFEFIMPQVPESSSFLGSGINTDKDPSFSVIIYSLSSALHILLSFFFTYQLWYSIKKTCSSVRFRVKKIIAITSLSFLTLALVFASIFEVKIVTYSHHRTLEILKIVKWDAFLTHKIPLTSISWFSLFPLVLVWCGMLFSVVACIWSAVKAMDITQNQLEKEDFDQDVIWSEISMFSIVVSSVFVTSTVATIFYLNIGISFAANSGFGQFYARSADGMSVLWATCFSAIMIIIVLFPTGSMNEVARISHKKNRVLGKDTERFKFVYGALSSDRILKVLAILLTPVYIAAIRAVVA